MKTANSRTCFTSQVGVITDTAAYHWPQIIFEDVTLKYNKHTQPNTTNILSQICTTNILSYTNYLDPVVSITEHTLILLLTLQSVCVNRKKYSDTSIYRYLLPLHPMFILYLVARQKVESRNVLGNQRLSKYVWLRNFAGSSRHILVASYFMSVVIKFQTLCRYGKPEL